MKNLIGRSLTLTLLVATLVGPAWADNKKDDPSQIGNRRVAHRSIISEEREIGIGKEYATEIERSAKLITDPVINEYVNRLGQNIVRNSDATIPFTIKVIDSPEINAFALPGGFLYVNSGLLTAAEEEDHVAGVMAHEIAHVTARHWASQMTKMQIANLAQIPLAILTGGLSYPVWYGVWNAYGFAVPLAFLKFSRGSEAEADYLGLQYMYKAGYDPNAYVQFFGKLIEENRKHPGSIPTVFSSHPPTEERILKSEETIKTILPKREQYLVTTSEFEDVKARLQSLMSMNRKTESPQEAGKPTLKKRPAPQGDEDSGQKTEDKPPVLKRR